MESEQQTLLHELDTLLAAHIAAPCGCKDDVTARLTLEIKGKRGGPRALNIETGLRSEIDIREMLVNRNVLDLAQKDLQVLGAALAKNPAAVIALFDRLRVGDGAGAVARLGELGLTESDFRAQGGGFWGVFVLAVLLVLVVQTPTSSEADPIPIPPDPIIVDDQTAEDMEHYLGHAGN